MVAQTVVHMALTNNTQYPPPDLVQIAKSSKIRFSLNQVQQGSEILHLAWTWNWTCGQVLCNHRTLDQTSVQFWKVQVRTLVQNRTAASLLMLISPYYISLSHSNPLFLLTIPSTMVYSTRNYPLLLILHLFLECVRFSFLFWKEPNMVLPNIPFGNATWPTHVWGYPRMSRNVVESFGMSSLVLSNSKVVVYKLAAE